MEIDCDLPPKNRLSITYALFQYCVYVENHNKKLFLRKWVVVTLVFESKMIKNSKYKAVALKCLFCTFES